MWANGFDKICSFEKKHFRLTRTCTVVGLFVGGVGGGALLRPAPERGKPAWRPYGTVEPRRPGGTYPAFSAGLIIRFITNRRSFSVWVLGRRKNMSPRAFYSYFLHLSVKNIYWNRLCAECYRNVKKKWKIAPFFEELPSKLEPKACEGCYKCFWNSTERTNEYFNKGGERTGYSGFSHSEVEGAVVL